MVGEVEEKKLYDAVLTGDVTTFRQLLQQDPNLLDRVSYVYCPNKFTPLHIATQQGNKVIVAEMLNRNKQLAKLLDSQKSSPFHIAAAEGYVEIARMLFLSSPKVCWWRDCHGMNPIHVAAMNGHVDILKNLIEVEPFPAREKVDGGQTVLHLCVKHGQPNALKVLVESLDDQLVYAEDEEGDTILHLAVRCDQIQIIQYLVNNNIIERSKVNSKGKTALDIFQEIPLQRRFAEDIIKILSEPVVSTRSWKAPSESLDKFREIGMVIAVLIATMAFQAVVSPPGGVWQEDSSTHRAGAAVMADTHPKIYKHFVRANTVAFASSLIMIFLLTTRLSSIHVVVTVAVMHTMWVSLASIAVSYGVSLMVITPNTQTQSIFYVIVPVVAVSVSIIGLFWLRKCTIQRRDDPTYSICRQMLLSEPTRIPWRNRTTVEELKFNVDEFR